MTEDSVLIATENGGWRVPKPLEEARTVSDGQEWLAAVNEEIKCLKSKNSWVIADVPIGTKVIDSTLIFALKCRADRAISKRNARVVATGFHEGYFEDLYAPFVDFSIVRLILVILSWQGACIHQMDVKSAIWNGRFDDDESSYLNSPQGLDLGVKHRQALKFLKAVYVLKRAPKIWNNNWNTSMMRIRFGKPKADERSYFTNIWKCGLCPGLRGRCFGNWNLREGGNSSQADAFARI